MIYIYLGNTLKGCSKKIIEDIGKKSAKGTHVLIVPDKFTLSTELKILQEVKSTLNIEVVTFSRLAMRVLENNNKVCLSQEGAVMLLAGVLEKCHHKLLCYSKSYNSIGFAQQMYACISTIRNNGITVEQLKAAADKLKGYTKNKTLDIITIYSSYIEELQENYIDSTTRLEQLRDLIKDSKIISDTNFYITDFYAFTGIQYDIIRELMQHALSVSVAVISVSGGDNKRIFPYSLLSRIKALAIESGRKVQEVTAFESLTKTKQIIEDNIFGYSNNQFATTDYINLFVSKTVDEEVEFVCRQISRMVRKEKLRYKQISVVCGDIATYTPYFEKNFEKYNIPYALDTKSTLSSQPFVKALLLYMKVNLHNYSRSAVIEYAKNYFSKIGKEVFEFENYCIRYDIDYSRFLNAFTIGEKEEQELAEEVRQKLYTALKPLPSKATIREYIKLLYDFVVLNGYEERLKSLADEQLVIDKPAASITAQLPQKLSELLSELEQLMGDMPCSLQQFFDLVQSGFDSASISVLPQSADCVYVGEAEDSRYEDKKILFIIGATEGAIPFDTKDEGILGEREFVAWQQADVVIQLTAREKSMHSKFFAEQLLLIPSDKLYVSYSKYSPKGSAQMASIIVQQLASLFCADILNTDYIEEGKVYTISDAYSQIISRTRQIRREGISICKSLVLDSMYHSLPAKLREKVDALIMQKQEAKVDSRAIFFKNKYTSISQLECYFGCPYKHFVQYGLLAKERVADKVQAYETGIIIHDVLEEYYRTTTDFSADKNKIHKKTNAIIDKIYKKPRFASIFAGSNAIQLKRLRQEILQIVVDLSRLTSKSNFVPFKFEARFGGKRQDYESIKLLQEDIELIGKIDRIDKYGEYVAVIDYKTGAVDAHLKHAYYGKKIQLFVYLGALREAGKKPCAAFYLPLKGEYKNKKEAESRYCYQGQLINESYIIEGFDKTIIDSNSSEIIPVTQTGGQYKARKNILLEYSQMNTIIDYVIKLSNKAVSEILEGNIQPNPLNDECKYCLAKPFCKFDSSPRADCVVELADFEVN